MYLIAKGIAVGFSIAAPVGAIGFLCIEQTLQGGMLSGIACGLGAATADMMYGILVALGLSATQSMLLGYKLPLMIIGGIFLCYLGMTKFFTAPSLKKVAVSHVGLLQSYGVTFLLTLTNPATILDFMALFTGLNIDMSGYIQSLNFIAGVFIGSAMWWLILCFCVGLFRTKISIDILKYINYVAGIAILSFGIYALMQAAQLWYSPTNQQLDQVQAVKMQDYIMRKATMSDEFALKKLYKKVAIIGCAGSGKTYLTFKLAEKLHVPVYHLDQYAWKPDWQRVDFEEFKKIHYELCSKDAWIIEGIYFKLLHERVQAADLVIFLDMPRSVCLWNVIKRSFFNWGKVIEGNPQGCVQNVFSFKFLQFLQWIWNFDHKHRSDILQILQEFESSKQIYVIKSRQEMNDFIFQLPKRSTKIS